MFSHVEPYPGDPILGLNEAFGRDPRPDKVNLSIGIYFDETGRLPSLPSVRLAERQLLSENTSKPYLPMEGARNFREAAAQLVFGPSHPCLLESRLAIIQTVGSSAGLRIGGEFLRRYFPGSRLYVSDPTWDNHVAVFEAAGLEVGTYAYFDPRTGAVDFAAMLSALKRLPPRSIVLLHACCHNPTGADLTHAQWGEVADVLKAGGLIGFLDMAYQGWGNGFDDDAFAPRLFASRGLAFLIVNSFSKSMSLYGERCGALTVVTASPAQAESVLGQLKSLVRKLYSSPPTVGSQIAARLIMDPVLRAMWSQEVAGMRGRIQSMRQTLYELLVPQVPAHDFSYLRRQCGMFSFTGMTPREVDDLRETYGVYLVRSGRMCIAGLNEGNVARTAGAIASVLQRRPG
jgi:aromatic-amino-acid transaminase